MKTVESTALDDVGYKGNVLYVKFKGNGWYEYPNVPQELFEKLLRAESRGAFLNKVIKPQYQGYLCRIAPTFQPNS